MNSKQDIGIQNQQSFMAEIESEYFSIENFISLTGVKKQPVHKSVPHKTGARMSFQTVMKKALDQTYLLLDLT